jgi:hypothetical protein
MRTRAINFFSIFFICSISYATPVNTEAKSSIAGKSNWSLYQNKELGYEFWAPNKGNVRLGKPVSFHNGDTVSLLTDAAMMNKQKFNPDIISVGTGYGKADNLKIEHGGIISIPLPINCSKKAVITKASLKKYLVIFTLENLPKAWSPQKIFVGKMVTIGNNIYFKVDSEAAGMSQPIESQHYFIKSGNKYHVISFLLAYATAFGDSASFAELQADLKNETEGYNDILTNFRLGV